MPNNSADMVFQAAKRKAARLSIGDVLRAKGGNAGAVYVVTMLTYQSVHLVNVQSRKRLTASIIDVIKYYDFVYDNNGERSIEEAIVWYNSHNEVKQLNPKQITKMVERAVQREIEVRKTELVPDNGIQRLTDVLKVGDIIIFPRVANWARLEVLAIDPIQEYVLFRNIETNKEDTRQFDVIDAQATKVGEMSEMPAAPMTTSVLTVTKTKVEEVYLPNYSETWRDRRYIKYCKRMGRDELKKYTYTAEEIVEFDYADVLKWLRTNLTQDDINKIVHDLKKHNEKGEG